MKKYLMGTWVEGWREAKAQNLTFIVTEDCNLRCKYCYVTHKYLKDSIIHLWNIGINEVAANVVFEDVWKENDDIIFEQQLKQLADYVIENEFYYK